MKKRILVVDDAAVMRSVISNIIAPDPNLAVMGFASNGKEALEKLSTVKPDIILLDIEMPEMSGLEFLRHARLRTQAKIIIISSIATGAKALEAKRLGADAVIVKPSGAVSYDLADKRGSELIQTIYRLTGVATAV